MDYVPPSREGMPIQVADAPAQVLSPPSIGYAKLWLIALLMLASVLSFADKSILQILVDPIKADIKIDDVQASLLMGVSFTVLFALAALPFGALSDAVDRRKMIAIAILAWSTMTILSGFSTNFGQLFVGRMGLGIAEAALGPATFSLIRDSFPPSQRGRAFACMQASHNFGTGGALAGGGAILGLAGAGTFVHWPIIGGLHPWQQVMVFFGLIGVPVAALIMTMRDPGRTTSLDRKSAPGFRYTLGFVGRHKGVFLPYWAGLGVMQTAQGGLSAWTVMAAHRAWNIPIPSIGAVLGPIQIATALIGAFTFGTVLDMVTKRGVKDAPLKAGCIGLSLLVVTACGLFFFKSLPMAFGFYIAIILFMASNSTSASAALALMAPSVLSGKMTAISGMVMMLVGFALGPTLVAVVGQHVYSGPRALLDGLVTVVVGSITCGVLLYLLALRNLRRRRDAGLPEIATLV